MTQLIQTPIQVGSLTVLDGCMFAGKSGTLIHEANTLRRQNINVVIVAPAMSRRRESEKERLESHDGVVALCETSYLEVDQLYQVCLSLNAQVICIDEAQFFNDLLKTCLDLRKRGVAVLVAGLSLTSNRTPFGEMHALLDRADNVVKRKAVCEFCHRYNATLSFRTCDDKETICVGGKAQYVPSCQLCFDERFKN